MGKGQNEMKRRNGETETWRHVESGDQGIRRSEHQGIFEDKGTFEDTPERSCLIYQAAQ